MKVDEAIEALKNEIKIYNKAKSNLEEWKYADGTKKYDLDIKRFEEKIESIETLIEAVEKLTDELSYKNEILSSYRKEVEILECEKENYRTTLKARGIIKSDEPF